MGKKMFALFAGVIVLVFLFLGGSYNSLVLKTTAIDAQWAQVETQYQRRFDLIPNLVSSTQGFLRQEREIFEDIAKARTQYSGAATTEDRVAAAGNVESALARLLVIVENYPTLKSNETVARLMDELAGTENRVSVERRRYNDLVQEYNGTIARVPTNIVARFFGFPARDYFQSVTGAQEPPKVEL